MDIIQIGRANRYLFRKSTEWRSPVVAFVPFVITGLAIKSWPKRSSNYLKHRNHTFSNNIIFKKQLHAHHSLLKTCVCINLCFLKPHSGLKPSVYLFLTPRTAFPWKAYKYILASTHQFKAVISMSIRHIHLHCNKQWCNGHHLDGQPDEWIT